MDKTKANDVDAFLADCEELQDNIAIFQKEMYNKSEERLTKLYKSFGETYCSEGGNKRLPKSDDDSYMLLYSEINGHWHTEPPFGYIGKVERLIDYPVSYDEADAFIAYVSFKFDKHITGGYDKDEVGFDDMDKPIPTVNQIKEAYREWEILTIKLRRSEESFR